MKKKYTLSELLERLPDIDKAAPFEVRPEYLEGLDRVLHLIEKDLSHHHSMKKLALEAQLNIYHLKILFRLVTGYSLYQYLIELRMQQAGALLLTTDYSVKRISQLSGYRNQNDFSERFKKRFQLTPLKYKSRKH